MSEDGEKPGSLHSSSSCHHCDDHPLIPPARDPQEAWGSLLFTPSEGLDRRFQVFALEKKKKESRDVLQQGSHKNGPAFGGLEVVIWRQQVE